MIKGMSDPVSFKNKWSYFIIVLIACSTLLMDIAETRAYDLSAEDERIAGEKFVQDVKKYFEIVDNDFLNTYINDLGQYLTSSLETKPFPFRFYIINNSTLNAFAGPGGHVFIFSGLVDVLDSLDELVGVLCHEIGHVSARHIAQRIETNKKIGLATMAGVLAAVLIGGEVAAPMIAGSAAAGIQAQLHYSREDERQADQLGFKYMENSGFHPAGMVNVLKKLQQGQWPGTDVVPVYLRTHPAGPERIARMEIMMTEHATGPEKKEAAAFSRDFPVVRTILKGKYLDPYEAERLFRMDLEKNIAPEMAHLGLGIVWSRRSEYEKAVDHLKTALNSRPDSAPILSQLGEVYQLQGQDKKAVYVLEKALRTHPRDKSSLNLLAASYQNLEDYGKAVRVYEKLKTMQPVKDELFYNLGIAYGRMNRLDVAHYHFGLYFKRQGDKKKALFHFEKAAGFSRYDHVMKERIDKAMKDLR